MLRPSNYLLQQLSQADFDLICDDLRPVPLARKQTLYEPGDGAHSVYFPESGLLSVITVMESGATCEASVIGRDSVFGFVEASGSGKVYSRVVVQTPGSAWMAPACRVRAAFDHSEDFRAAIRSDIEMRLAESRQRIACNGLHTLHQRFARWLLDGQETWGAGRLILTQEFLADMLGVQRTTVTKVVSEFKAERLIRQRRGSVELMDLTGLERRSCECRATIASLRKAITPFSATTYGERASPSRIPM